MPPLPENELQQHNKDSYDYNNNGKDYNNNYNNDCNNEYNFLMMMMTMMRIQEII